MDVWEGPVQGEGGDVGRQGLKWWKLEGFEKDCSA